MSENKISYADHIKNVIAGGIGGMCLVAVGHPLDTIKVSLQTMQKQNGQMPYDGALDCAKKIFKKEKLHGFYKGMGAPIAGITPIYALTFFGFSLGKSLQQSNYDIQEEDFTIMQRFNAGMFAGGCACILTAPVERVKCLLQVQNMSNSNTKIYIGPMDCCKKLFRQNGFKSIYRGFWITLLRDMPNTGIYFASYELLLEKFSSNIKSEKELNPLATLFAGGLAGMAFWVFAVPFDIIKSRLQAEPNIKKYSNGSREIFKNLINNEGLLALYKGSFPMFLRAFPANAACFFGYEATMSLLNMII